MKVHELCAREILSCGPEASLAEAGCLMWQGDCGVIPVVDSARRVVGILTDRDICIALATRDRKGNEIRVSDVMTQYVHCCGLDDDVDTALALMEESQVRRLPVVDQEGSLQGMLSINDLILAAKNSGGGAMPVLSYQEVVDVLKAACRHRNGKGVPIGL